MSTLDEYLEKHRQRLERATKFQFDKYDEGVIAPEGRAEMLAACDAGLVYMVGGRSAELAGRGSTERT
jgi:hypothetical protein